MRAVLKSAAFATSITFIVVATIALLSVVPILVLNTLAFWLVEGAILLVYFVTSLPVGTEFNGFLKPNAFGIAVLITLVWLSVFFVWLLIAYMTKRNTAQEDREQEGCYACGSTGIIQVGSLNRVCGVCDGSGR